LATGFFHVRRGFLQQRLVDVDQHHLGACRGDAQGHFPAHALGRARHHHNLAF
jgi:hypothetical protein